MGEAERCDGWGNSFPTDKFFAFGWGFGCVGAFDFTLPPLENASDETDF